MGKRSRVAPTLAPRVPPGSIGVISGLLSRYTDFTISLLKLKRPPDSPIIWAQGVNLVHNYNSLVERMVGDWLWIMGDDHIFQEDMLLKLLERDVDVVAPLCLMKAAPFSPIAFGSREEREDGLYEYHEADLPETGLCEVLACGSAGILIRRHVIEALQEGGGDVFETTHGIQNEDLILCEKIREAGFKIHVDVDQRLGHIGVFGVYPMWQGDCFGTMLSLGDGQVTPLWRIKDEQPSPELAESAA